MSPADPVLLTESLDDSAMVSVERCRYGGHVAVIRNTQGRIYFLHPDVLDKLEMLEVDILSRIASRDLEGYPDELSPPGYSLSSTKKVKLCWGVSGEPSVVLSVRAAGHHRDYDLHLTLHSFLMLMTLKDKLDACMSDDPEDWM